MKNKKAFLIGVGGIGVSALAKHLHNEGHDIVGSDREENENVKHLIEKYELQFLSEHDSENITDDIDFVVYSPAVPDDNPEKVEAQKKGIKLYSYPEFLGKISEEKYTVSIAGTNGKTTTTTMTAELLDKFAIDPMVVVGGIARKFNSNFLLGSSDNFVVESCEYKDSFLNLHPNVIAITNITPDHLDHFGTFDNYKKVFSDFLGRAKGDKKVLICSQNDQNLTEVLEKAEELDFNVVDYKGYEIETVAIPGEYNRENAQVALAIADLFDVDLDNARKYLAEEYVGSGRRFEYTGKTENGMEVYDDYAHNPEALDVLLSGVQEKFPDKKNILVFQPHLFSRTEDFFDGFIRTIAAFDIVYLLSIYEARENPAEFSITSEMLFEKVKQKNAKAFFCTGFTDCLQQIQEKNYNQDHVLLTVGAGGVYRVGKDLTKE